MALVKALLNPYLTGCVLGITTFGPSLSGFDPPFSIPGFLTTSLVGLFAVGTLSSLSGVLSESALGNSKTRSRREWSNWEKEIAVVTGGSNGFGALVSKGLAEKGVQVVVLDIRPLSKDMESNSKIHYIECDITNPDAVTAAADRIHSKIGHPTILVNNAGIGLVGTVLVYPPKRLKQIFDVNVLSHWYTIQAFLPAMLEAKHGHIVTIASMASYISLAEMTTYAATKAALLGLHEGLTQELKHRHNCPEIRTSIVHPYYAKTGLIHQFEKSLNAGGTAVLTADEVANAILKQIFEGRAGQVFIPEWMGIARCTRAFPIWLQERVRSKLNRDCMADPMPEEQKAEAQ